MPKRDIEAIFHEARTLDAPRRAAYLDSACGSDLDLRAKVEALLAADAQASRFLRDATELETFDGDPSTPSRTPSSGGPASSGERPGEVIGRYKLLQNIGEGGFGTVWLAEQSEPVVRRVAIKVIKLGMDTKQVIARFEAERQALALMDHPNIARVFDAGTTATGRPYFVMEYIRGVPILEYCDSQKLDTRARLDLFAQVCHAIQHAHQKGIIHRDIKPSNVLVTMHDGVASPKVIDFGIAKATNQKLTEKTLFTEHHQMVGTPAYMSPEQAEMSALDVDTRSDIYSLGVLLYEMLTGTTPFDTRELLRKGLAEMMRVIREDTPHKPSTRLSTFQETATRTAELRRTDVRRLGAILRGDLDWIVMKCLEKDRTRRYETANGLAADIARHLNNQPVVAGPPSAAYRVRKFVRRNRAGVTAGLAVAGALVLGVVGTTLAMVRAMDEKARADEAAAQAIAARAETQHRAEQLERVAAFQASSLSDIDVPQMGVRLRQGLLESVRSATAQRGADAGAAQAAAEQADLAIAGADFTGVALAALEGNVFAPSLKAVEAQFADQPDVRADLLLTIGKTTLSLGMFDISTEALEGAVSVRADHLGANDPKTLDARTELAIVRRNQGRYDDAEREYLAILDDARAGPGEDAFAFHRALYGLGVLYNLWNKPTQAEPLLRRSLAWFDRHREEHEVDYFSVQLSLGTSLALQDRFDEAEPLNLAGLAGFREELGSENARTLTAINNVGAFYQRQRKMAEAEALYAEALEGRRVALGEMHPDTITSLENLGGVYYQQNKLDEAMRCAQEALDRRTAVFGDNNAATLRSWYNTARILDTQKRPAEAEARYRIALAGFRRVYGEFNPNTIRVGNDLSGALFAQGKFAEIESLLLDEMRRLDANPAAPKARRVSVMTALSRVYGFWDKAEPEKGHAAQAAQWAAKVEAIKEEDASPTP